MFRFSSPRPRGCSDNPLPMDALVFVGAGIGHHVGDAAPTSWTPATAEGRFLFELRGGIDYYTPKAFSQRLAAFGTSAIAPKIVLKGKLVRRKPLSHLPDLSAQYFRLVL